MGYRTYYDATPYKRRYLIDNDLGINYDVIGFNSSRYSEGVISGDKIKGTDKILDYKHAIWDIECYDLDGFPHPLGSDGSRQKGDPITGIGYSPLEFDKFKYHIIVWFPNDSVSREYKYDNETLIHQVPTEQDMIDLFYYTGRKKLDFFGGWNSEKFDWDYVMKRDVKDRFKWCNFFFNVDMLERFRRSKVRGLASQRLDYVGDMLFDIPKVKLDHPISWFWKRDRNKFFEYLKRDLVITRKIEESKSLMRDFVEYSELIGLPVKKIKGQYTPGDTLIQRRMPKNTFYYPVRRPNVDKVGGLQLEPVSGVYNVSLMMDFTSLYNRVDQTFNIDQQTMLTAKNKKSYNGDIIETPYGTKFMADRRGVIPSLLHDLEENRNRAKEKMKSYPKGSDEYERWRGKQFTLKTGLLSIPGALGYEKGYYYDPHLYNSITISGRYFMKLTKKYLKKKYGLETLYGHTDSCKVETNVSSVKEGVEFGKRLVEDLNQLYFDILEGFGVPEEWRVIEIKLEKVYESFIVGRKKSRNAGLIGWQEGQYTLDLPDKKRLDVTGFPLVNYRWPELSQKLMEKVLIFILKGRSRYECREFIKGVKREMFKGKYDHLLLISQRLGKEIEDYQNKNSQHVRAAIKLQNRTGQKLKKGDTIRYWIRHGNITHPEQLEVPDDIDYSYYIGHLIDNPINNLMNIAYGSRHMKIEQFLV